MKSSLLSKILLILNAIQGIVLKWFIDFKIIKVFSRKRGQRIPERLVVSLTSYGRRVNKTVYYTIVSLLRQSYTPDVIVLWLDSWEWNDNNIPMKLKTLQKYGLEIRYTDDRIKSYKKLVHSLEVFPNDIIITVDDDMYYKSDLIERMLKAYNQNPNCLYTNLAHIVRFSKDKMLLPYNEWIHDQKGVANNRVFMLGVGACLYKKELLHEDVTKSELYTKLSPKADDVWFYFMAILKHTPRVALSYTGTISYHIDLLYQLRHPEGSLMADNCGESQNDIQIHNVINHYNINIEDLM